MDDEFRDTTKRTYNEIASDYAKRDDNINDEAIMVLHALDAFINVLPAKARVLDVGFGGGRDSRYLKRHGLDVTGIDIAERMVKEAKKRDSQGDYRVMDFENLDFHEQRFDGIWANASLHHLPKNRLSKVLTSMCTILKSGGYMHIIVKQGGWEGFRTNHKFDRELTRYFAFYQPDELRGLFDQVDGFEVVDTQTAAEGEWLHVMVKRA